MSNSKVPDNPLGDVELKKKLPPLPLRDILGIFKWGIKYPDYVNPEYKNYSNGRAVKELDSVEPYIEEYVNSEADKRVEAVLDRLEEQTVMMYFLYDDVTKHDVVPLSAIEAERQRLNKEKQ